MKITAERARQLFDYNPDTGELRWKTRSGQPQFNGQYARKVVGCVQATGYRQFTFQQQGFSAHRVIWLLVHGEWPDQIDHINGDRADNRMVNLRSVTGAENSQNQAIHKNNVSGFCGVSWHSTEGRWQAYIRVNGKAHSLGRFDDFEAAKAARLAAERKYGFHPNHGRPANSQIEPGVADPATAGARLDLARAM